MYLKKPPLQLVFFEFCKTFQTSFLMNASGEVLVQDSSSCVSQHTNKNTRIRSHVFLHIFEQSNNPCSNGLIAGPEHVLDFREGIFINDIYCKKFKIRFIFSYYFTRGRGQKIKYFSSSLSSPLLTYFWHSICSQRKSLKNENFKIIEEKS